MEYVTEVLPQVHAEPFQCALQDRILGPGIGGDTTQWRCVLIVSGRGLILRSNDDVLPLEAPCLAWFPSDFDHTFKIKAGGVGYQFIISDRALENTIGHSPEASELRGLIGSGVVARLGDAKRAVADASHAFDLIVREIQFPQVGSWTLIEAQVWAILVTLWRKSGSGPLLAANQGHAGQILQHFRRLVEKHFRDRWSGQQYATALGVSTDRLHDMCRRELGKPPMRLVHERTIHEAKRRLERSTQTVEQLSASLGFRDVGHFSRFFKSKTGLPPGAFRRQAKNLEQNHEPIPTNDYADWP